MGDGRGEVTMTSNAQIDLRSLLLLSAVPGIGQKKIQILINAFGDAAAILKATPLELVRRSGISERDAVSIARREDQQAFADEQLKRIEKHKVLVLTLWDEGYPDLLKKIYDPPVMLFVRGGFLEADVSAISLVGTRRPSEYGRTMAEQFGKEFSLRGITTVSGMARGIDTIVHSSSLRAGGRTIAVLGSGVDVPYPSENAELMKRIIEHGAVVSECVMGALPDSQNFPRRNRIISGLSIGTIIVESNEDGGALITASEALDQGREVFAIPGNVTSKPSAGTNKLIREGRAKLVGTIDEVIEELHPGAGQRFVHSQPLQIELTLFEAKIFERLTNEPMQIDDIASQTGISTVDTLINLLSMEFKGVVKQLPGKFFIRE
jgi:DNA processing protein